jgi:hypothetical protein
MRVHRACACIPGATAAVLWFTQHNCTGNTIAVLSETRARPFRLIRHSASATGGYVHGNLTAPARPGAARHRAHAPASPSLRLPCSQTLALALRCAPSISKGPQLLFRDASPAVRFVSRPHRRSATYRRGPASNPSRHALDGLLASSRTGAGFAGTRAEGGGKDGEPRLAMHVCNGVCSRLLHSQR